MEDHLAGFDLDVVGAMEGTDKSSAVAYCWDYLRHYQDLFAPWRDKPINFIEIGVENGASLNVWRQYFSQARIVGIDINLDCRRHAGDRVVIEIGSQEDPGFLHQVCAKYPPSIIIDDGSHLAHHMVYSFERLFPMLQPGGIYVVEDFEFQFGLHGDWSGKGTVSAPDYFLDLARARMANRTSIGEVWGDLQYIRDHVDCVTFFGGVVAIRKKRPRDVARALPYADQVLQSFNTSPAHLIRLAEYILRYDGPADQAERAVRNAIKLSGPLSETLGPLVEALIRQQKWDDAGELANQAVRLRPADHSAWGWLSHVERHRGRAEDAIAALERASSLNPDVAHYHDQLYHLRYQAGDLGQALRAAKSAARLNPKHALWRRRVEDLERQVNPPAQ